MARTLFPVFLDLVDRPVLVVGGGRVAAPKISRLVDAGADVFVVSPAVAPEIVHLPVRVALREFEPRDLEGCWYVVSAAPPEVNRRVAREAHARGIFVNAVDDPQHASAFAGSGFRRGPVTVAISTGGDAPALARILREALERLVGRDVEAWNELAVGLRGDWRREQLPMEHRRDALLAAIADLHREAAGAPATAPGRGFVSLVGAGPGDPDLLTRRAARRLAEADLVLYDALVSPATVSLATNAQRILVGRRRGSGSVGQGAIIRTLIRAARRGRRVVRLKGGDPFVFGRGGEEALALAGAGVPFEVVPGVSSAFAAPALASIPVTHRGLSSAVLVTTGHDVDQFGTLMRGITPGAATLVILMGTAHRSRLSSELRASGWHASTPTAIVWNASARDAAVWTGPLDALGEAMEIDGAPGTIVVGEVVALRDTLTAELTIAEREARHG